ncbi:hypothetical protein ACHQM5_006908 [Ranunculus cassubicifolius]
MYAIKGGWVGQTFALAKSNDSGGKKTRIRRSKEDRKAMVESFVKRYQNSNNGSFPSLNLTHKEVGGSFYTVRELVREIIQENRVLGPATPNEDEQKNDQSHEHYPLGSVSIGVPNHVSFASNGTQVSFQGYQNAIKELNGTIGNDTNGQPTQTIANEQHINGNIVDTVEISTPKVTPIETDVVVEVFPIKSPSKVTQGNDDGSLEAAVNFQHEETKIADKNSEIIESSYSSLHENSVEQLETSISSTAEIITTEEELTLPTSNENLVVSEMETESTLKNQLAGSEDISDNQNALRPENRSKSWEGSSRGSTESETNPVFAVFKAFFSAFVKFWTE